MDKNKWLNKWKQQLVKKKVEQYLDKLLMNKCIVPYDAKVTIEYKFDVILL